MDKGLLDASLSAANRTLERGKMSHLLCICNLSPREGLGLKNERPYGQTRTAHKNTINGTFILLEADTAHGIFHRRQFLNRNLQNTAGFDHRIPESN
jgi:hypothetical protein